MSSSYAESVDFSDYNKHNESIFIENGKTYKVKEDLVSKEKEIKKVSQFFNTKGELLEIQITTVDRLTGVVYFENRNVNQKIINSKKYKFDEIVKQIESHKDTHSVFATYSRDNRGKFLRHEEYTINLFGEKATALVVGSILAGVLVIAPEMAISLGTKLITGATSAGLLASSGTIPWNVRASIDVYSSPLKVGKHYIRYYGDFYTTGGEYITKFTLE